MGRTKIVGDEDVLDAARRIFRRDGHAASTRDVAREAGISQAVLYQRFKTKDELFFAAMAPSQPDLTALLGDPEHLELVEAETHPREIAARLYQYVAEAAPSLLHLATHPAFGLAAISRAHERIGSGALGRALADRIGLLKARERVGASVDAEAFAAALIAAVHGLALHDAIGGSAGLGVNDLDAMIRAMCKGIGL